MKKVVCLIIALTVASLCFAEDDKPYTFAGIPWGTTKEDIIKFVAEKTDFEASTGYVYSDNHYNKLVYKSGSSKIAFCFYRDEFTSDKESPLSSVEIVSRSYFSDDSEIQKKDFQEHLDRLIKKYGEPFYLKHATQKTYQKIYSSQMQKLYGTPLKGLFDSMKIMWINDESAIIVTGDSTNWNTIYTCDDSVINDFFYNILPYSDEKKQSLDDMF